MKIKINILKKIKNKVGPHSLLGLFIFSNLFLFAACDRVDKVKILEITSDPTSAEVFIDGRKKGLTPLKLHNITTGVYLLEIHKEGFVPSFENLTIIKGEIQTVEKTLKPVKGLLLVDSNPQGAELTVDGVFKGTTPVLISDLPLGSYTLAFKATGKLPRVITTELKNRTPVYVLADLASNMAQLTVNSTPTNAEVRVDGNLIGKTPLVYDQIQAGKANVSISLKGYRSYSKKMKFEASKAYTITTTLRPLPAGLTILSTPKNARVLLDGKFVGKTPLTIEKISTGTHQITARLPGYARQKKTIQLQPDAKQSVEFTLVKDSGTLVVDTEPANVEIYVDGRHVTTTVQKGPSDALSQTARLLLKSKKKHKIQFVREGFISKEITIQTKVNEVVTKHIVLKRIFVYDTRITTKKEVIDCRIEYKLPNGDIYYECYPGVFDTVKADDILKIESISINDQKNKKAQLLMEQNKKPDQK